MTPSITERLFHSDAGLRSFTGRVLAVSADGREVTLDRTAFYPTSGGQPHDTGMLGGVPVVEVTEGADGAIVHHGAHAFHMSVGEGVSGEIDGARRDDLTQQHSGQHLLSALFADRFGLETRSVHMGETHSTLDLGAGSIAPELLLEIEAAANRCVAANIPVSVGWEDAEEAARRGLRKPSERGGLLRIVTIEGLDRSACGGTHVEGTAAIGPILLRGTEKMRGDTRVTFFCGERALARARADHEALGVTARTLGTTPAEVPALVEAQRDRLKELEAVRRRLEAELGVFHMREAWAKAVPGRDGVRRIVERVDASGTDRLQAMAQSIAPLERAVFIGMVAGSATILLATSADSGVDAGARLRPLLEAAGGRGGGSPRLARGSLPEPAAVEGVLRQLLGEAGS
jgi:alanyl-tRNA synthetase